MNGKDLLIGLGSISPKYFDEAENDTITEAKAHRRFRRPLLVAAIIALLLMLVGCAVVYVLRLQDMSIGQETYTQTFDDNGKYLDEPVEKTRDIITIYGHSGDPIQQALTEWFAFLENYDPDGALMTNDSDLPEISNQYEYIYSCYTQDMVDKVDEIAEKYGLNLLETRVPIQHWQSDIFLKETGINSLVLPDSGAKTEGMAGMLYLPGNFHMEFTLTMPELGKLGTGYDYTRKDYFPRDFPGGGIDLSNYQQWDHTAPDGTPLLLALSNKGHGIIIAQPGNAMINISISGNFSGSSYPKEDEVISMEDLEQIADSFDYSISPGVVDIASMEAQLKEAEAAYQAENTYVPETYGSFTDYIKETIDIPDDTLQYVFHDMNGDGQEDLLIGREGAYDRWVTIQNGETRERMVMNTYVCEGNVTEQFDIIEIYETHIYVAPISETVIDDIDAEMEVITVLRRIRNQWTQGPSEFDQTEITEAEAMAVMAQYPRIELNWKPLMDYPLDDTGYTLADYIAKQDVRLSRDELLNLYKEYITNLKNMHYSHYRILDINGDGVDDLLLKGEDSSWTGNTDFYWIALTYRYGEIRSFAFDFYLCEDNVLENISKRNNYGEETEGHQFSRMNGLDEELLDFAAHNKATASWQGDWYNDIPLTDTEANAILAKYPRVDQGMRPISELLN